MSSLATERSAERPQIGLPALATGFLKMGLCGFGGVLPFARRVIVEERQWLSEREFVEILGLCQALPGPNVVNTSIIIGERFAGLPGSLTCIASLMAAPILILVALGELYEHWAGVPKIDAAIGGMAIAAAALIAGNGLKMLRRLKLSLRSLFVAAATFSAIGLLHWPLIPVVLVMSLVSFLAQGETAR
ncbi:chromate transporter [Rhizobiales bacterium GAS191]|nr:chromate transporter [Rhizobiales bacterium GAS191]